jgi:hypothetical protein
MEETHKVIEAIRMEAEYQDGPAKTDIAKNFPVTARLWWAKNRWAISIPGAHVTASIA